VIASEHGLSGREWAFAGRTPDQPPSRRVIAILEDERYLYALRLESALPAESPHDHTFRALVRSVRPVPRGEGAPGPRPLLDQWVD
jgi:hypothetical protein